MPSIAKALDGGTTVFADEKPNAKIKPSFIMVDNVLGAQNAIITLQDRFTTSASNGAVAAARTIDRLRINVSMDACVSIRDELKDIDILGDMELVIATPDEDCHATIGWHFN